MEKEFDEYWTTHQRRLVLNAPERLRKDYLEAGRLDTPLDWLCFVIPIGVGIIVQPIIKLKSEILSWGIILVLVVILFALMQMLKPIIARKKSESEVLEQIKQFYYQRYKQTGDFSKIEPWRD